MRHQIAVFLDPELIEHIDWLTEAIGRRRGVKRVSRSEVLGWLVKQHRKKMQHQRLAKKCMDKAESSIIR